MTVCTRRITNESYHFTPLITPAKGQPILDYIETLTVYRDSGELQLNGNFFCFYYLNFSFKEGRTERLLFSLAPPIQNTRVEKEIVVYGILGFIKLIAGKKKKKKKKWDV